ncbi:MAG: 50S ribosomal protein L18 [Nitrosomonas sp.]|nr:50S ribosomal protein L18 [Nitrosomonas sp.]MCP5250638.1 50S ribosomal protein L18 [Burkholderiales bacterium]MCP5291152.1 50S ribosomal protein L18 [Burkholderiales bacterium]MDR4519757.1 50S ribosomal protein L18 [Nitrosomonas sp.]
MKNLKLKRLNRAKKTRKKIQELGVLRLTINRTNNHIYAQIIDDSKRITITSASSIEPEIKNQVKFGNNISSAIIIGKRIAEKAKVLGINEIAFDRSGYQYHGRVKALADSARSNGLKF